VPGNAGNDVIVLRFDGLGEAEHLDLVVKLLWRGQQELLGP
jgi:hypothetical protein